MPGLGYSDMYCASQARLQCCSGANNGNCATLKSTAWFWVGLAAILLWPKKGSR